MQSAATTKTCSLHQRQLQLDAYMAGYGTNLQNYRRSCDASQKTSCTWPKAIRSYATQRTPSTCFDVAEDQVTDTEHPEVTPPTIQHITTRRFTGAQTTRNVAGHCFCYYATTSEKCLPSATSRLHENMITRIDGRIQSCIAKNERKPMKPGPYGMYGVLWLMWNKETSDEGRFFETTGKADYKNIGRYAERYTIPPRHPLGIAFASLFESMPGAIPGIVVQDYFQVGNKSANVAKIRCTPKCVH